MTARLVVRSIRAGLGSLWLTAMIGGSAQLTTTAQEPLTGNLSVHDPSTMIKSGGRYYIFYTGRDIGSKSSADRLYWQTGPRVFSSTTRPTWTTTAVPGFDGTFWAPDIIYRNGQYFLYYSVSTFGSQVSAIGLATNPTLDPNAPNYQWTDQGPVIQSNSGVNYNTIDPSVLQASDGRLWMSFGSFWTGIKMIELNPITGKRISPNSSIYALAAHPPSTAIEGSCLFQRDNYFYLFVNWDRCCSGVDSTYNIRVGRSLSITGPYLDRQGVNLISGGGTMVLESTGRFIGPGHAGILTEGDTNWFTYHYYDGNNNGASRLGMARLHWDAAGWPEITNDWCAFYPFDTDAREHLGQYDGELQQGASITQESGRGSVLNLDGLAADVVLPLSVANASTYAAWVKWNGGDAWQRIFDFGDGISRYLFVTPMGGPNNRLRFAITTSGSSGEQFIEAPTALPVGAWCHVAVTLDGRRGVLYLDGRPVAANSALTLRPWQVLARTNYLGDSQWPADPAFNGKIDSFRIYGRALGPDEILQLAEAHPALAHRYSFTADASDSIGSSHGKLRGAADITNGTLHLNAIPGTCVSLPGGLVSGCTAVTLEFWATFGTNENGSCVFAFGTTNGPSGSDYLEFSSHTSTGAHEIKLATSGGMLALSAPETLDNRQVCIACVVDPFTGYSAIYTNGVLECSQSGRTPSLNTISTSLSYLGRSLFAGDALMNGQLDEFRIYDGRLEPEAIAADFAAGPDALTIPVTLGVSNSPTSLTFDWPAYAVGFTLQSSTSLDSQSTWSPVGEDPGLVGDNYRVTLKPPSSTRYYRLTR